MKKARRNKQTELMRAMVEQGFSRKAWHGPNLRGSIRGVTFREAARRPGPGRHNIWEIVVHAAYWKYVVRKRILPGQMSGFPINGRNWFRRPDVLSEKSWKHDIALLNRMHRLLLECISELGDGDLKKPGRGRNQTWTLLWGIAAHDVYHAGQIQLIKRLLGL